MKTDARVRYTQKVIKDTFLMLLQEKPATKITVKEVCDKAEINRGTFYKHYRDCYDLMDKLQAEALAQFEQMLDGIETKGAEPMLVAVLNAMRHNQALLCSLALGRDADRRFVQRLIGNSFQRLNLWLKAEPNQHWAKNPQRTMGYAFLAGGCSGVIEYWLQSGMKEPPEEIAKEITALGTVVAAGMTNS